MNEYKHFKDALGMEDDFELHTWEEIDRLNKVCEDYIIGSKTVLLEPHRIEFMNGDDVIIFRSSDGAIYSHFLKGGIHQEDLNSIYECVNSKSGLAKCRVDDDYNVLVWEVLDNDKNRQND
jgi:hypothetical protein